MGTVSTFDATAATDIPSTSTARATATARAFDGVSILRPTAWIAKPDPSPIMHSNAENATGALPLRPVMSAGITAYADAAAPNTHGATGATTYRKRRCPTAGIFRSRASERRSAFGTAGRVSGARSSARPAASDSAE